MKILWKLFSGDRHTLSEEEMILLIVATKLYKTYYFTFVSIKGTHYDAFKEYHWSVQFCLNTEHFSFLRRIINICFDITIKLKRKK